MLHFGGGALLVQKWVLFDFVDLFVVGGVVFEGKVDFFFPMIMNDEWPYFLGSSVRVIGR